MKTIEVTEKDVKAAFDVAKTDEMKNVLKALFGKDKDCRPNLDDYTSIKTYEDACEALEESPILSDGRSKALCAKFHDHYDFRQNMPPHIIALMKLETIGRALWGRDWKPQPDAKGNKRFYSPNFALYTQSEIDSIGNYKRGALVAGDAYSGSTAGFGCLNTDDRSSYSLADSGFRLCQETEEKAEYFGRQFIELWAEYLRFGFETGERIL